MMAVSLSFFLCIYIFSSIITLSSSKNITITEDLAGPFALTANQRFVKESNEPFTIFCFDNVPKSFLQIWRSVHLILEQTPLSYEVIAGENELDVREKYDNQSLWNPSSWLSGQKTSVEFPAFSHYCVGIITRDHYALLLNVRVVNYWRVLQTILGIMLFLSAPSLSRNSFFHYTSGVSLGILASLLILIFVISRFIPKKSASYAVMLFGYSVILYGLQVFWQQFNNILQNYIDFFLIYCFTTAFISFVVCYRLGPVQNVRTFNIIQWCMQGIAVILIYLGSEYREVSTALIIILITARMIPDKWVSWGQRFWYRMFPPKVKLLTEVEYIEQGNRETAKALDELRKFCRSPDCNTWKVVRQLKDPMRFSNFIDTGSHYTDEELLQYNSEGFDDDDEQSDQDSSNSFSNGYLTSPHSQSINK